ncbi:Wzz/FepE/Etk N-terminal domain-containing protein [Alcaligenes nematophilus]|uniref:LPS O-antigen chain length determinant protein WzzB n=1 Tax=Alcaligenes nematophilus TaxID=2994643 RepID=UPI0035B52D86
MENCSERYVTNNFNLRGVARALHAKKLFIMVCFLGFTAVSAIYAFFSTPIYKATTQTLPPISARLTAYNAASQLTGEATGGITQVGVGRVFDGIKPLSTETAYNIFLKHLSSDAVRSEFFMNYYLPAFNAADKKERIQSLLARLEKELIIALPKKADEFVAKVTFEGEDPERIAKWANKYVELAMTAAREELFNNLEGEVRMRQDSINNQIAASRQVAKVSRQAHVIRLRNALEVSDAMGLETPPPGFSLITVENSNITGAWGADSDNLMYLRGSKALRSQLQQLEVREDDEAYIQELPGLLKAKALLESIALLPESFATATVDRAASAPEEPVYPKKALTLALGMILGLMVAISGILVQQLFRYK